MSAARLVLVTIGFADHDRAAELRRTASRLGAGLAALQGDGLPSVTATLDELAASGTAAVRLLPVTRTGPETGASWVRRVAGHWVRSRGQAPDDDEAGVPKAGAVTEAHVVGVRVGAEVGDGSEVGDGARVVRVEVARGVERDPGTCDPGAADWRRVTGREAPLTSAAWEDPPPHSRHVLVCRGPRCNAQGAEEVQARLREELSARGVLDDGVLLTQTGCLFPCNRAPLVVVHPAGTWHAHLTPDAVPGFVDRELARRPTSDG